MDPLARIELALERALRAACGPHAPPRLGAALRHAVFPGGARVRPRLAIAAALACGDDAPELADRAAAAIELLHCASLVHDDMPCFDDAATRRGKATVHKAYGEPLALLAGDGLIVAAFRTLSDTETDHPARIPALLRIIGDAVGSPHGIVAGQAWECEPSADLHEYQKAKTAALFSGATAAGAAAAGAEWEPWIALGECLGEAYQVADDIADAAARPEEIGKPVGQDVALGRPSAVRALGLKGALRHLESLTAAAVAAIPRCPGKPGLERLIRHEARRLVPASLANA